MIRITGGEFRGRKIKSPPGLHSRPTIDRVREALFNILGNGLSGIRFVDLYSGVGLVGIEALSRGAQEVVFVEKEISLVKILRQNLIDLGVEKKAQIFHGSVAELIPRLIKKRVDIIFMDPPYESEEAAIVLAKLGCNKLPENVRVIVQNSSRKKLQEKIGSLVRTREARYGETALSFFVPTRPSLINNNES